MAWALCNHEDKIALKYILESIKIRCDNLKSSWFMSNMAPQYLNAWREVVDVTNKIFIVYMAH